MVMLRGGSLDVIERDGTNDEDGHPTSKKEEVRSEKSEIGPKPELGLYTEHTEIME
jgi:hypothetical protein